MEQKWNVYILTLKHYSHSIVHTNIVRFLQISTRNIASHRTVARSTEQKRLSRRLPTRIVVDSRRYVFSLRERAILLFSLSLSFFSSLWRMLFNAATTVRHVSEKEGEEGASAWAGGQSYRGGWLASVNGFRGQWREISRPVSQELWTRLLRLVPWTRGGSPGLSRWPMIWNRGRKGKKVKASPPDFCFLLHAIIISFSCFSIVLHE